MTQGQSSATHGLPARRQASAPSDDAGTGTEDAPSDEPPADVGTLQRVVDFLDND